MGKASSRTNLDEIKMFARFVRGLDQFLRDPLSSQQCESILKEALQRREEAFLVFAKRAIFDHRRSPYRRLLNWAGVSYADLEAAVRKEGIEDTLEKLFEAGVYVTLDEFKGRTAIQRNGLEVEVTVEDFDNPWLIEHFETTSGGSRGVRTRMAVDLNMIAHDTTAHSVFLSSFDLQSHPLVVWRPLPPGGVGIKKILSHSKLRKVTDSWFSQTETQLRWGNFKPLLFVHYTLYAGRRAGVLLPRPQYVPVSDAYRVADHLAELCARGTPAHVDTIASCALRVCAAARDRNLDLAGTFFRVGGEPFTQAKSEIIRSAGGRAVCHYSMAEAGLIGVACADAAAVDEVHLREDKLAVIQRSDRRGQRGDVPAFYFTTLIPLCPKVMLNVANGDYGTLATRNCECSFNRLGFHRHISGVRSYEKLTTGGMHFLGADLLVLLEEVLPRQFGGGPNDYQFIEEESRGISKVKLVVSPTVGEIDVKRCTEVVFQFLASRARENRMMVKQWREGHILDVVRREPYTTSSSKVLSLHLQRGT